MIRPRVLHIGAIAAPFAFAAWLSAAAAWAEVIQVSQGESAVAALSRAAPGDTLHLGAGTFKGDLVIDLPGVTNRGRAGSGSARQWDRQRNLGEGSGRDNPRIDDPRIGPDSDRQEFRRFYRSHGRIAPMWKTTYSKTT